MSKDTACVQAGTYRDVTEGGVNTPIFTSSAFDYADRGEIRYPRYFNTPNQRAVEDKMCALEDAEAAILFSSGMAAISTVLLSELNPGDHVVLLDALYGGTHAFAADALDHLGVRSTYVATEVRAIEDALTPATKAIVVESPTNPLMEIIDLRKVGALGKARGVTTVIDNTFATPINQTPINLGIDVVVHSGTKYLGGHSDLCCGVALTSTERARKIRAFACHLGGSLDATASYLLERSLKTLALRVQRQSENAQRIAGFLESDERVTQVYYPGLRAFPGHAIAAGQMSGFGGVLSFELQSDIDVGRFLGRLDLIRVAVSFGGVETMISSPAETSHHRMSSEERLRIGVTPSLLRLSAGIEDPDDVISDLNEALSGQ